MPIRAALYRNTVETLGIYWELVRLILPIAIATKILQDFGAIEAISPYLSPVMSLVGLQPELALAWLTGLMVGVWGAVVIMFTLVPVSALSTADVTILSSLVLFAHAIPIEQRLIQKAGPSLLVTAGLRIGGALLFVILLHQTFAVTGWLSEPVQPAWLPTEESPTWVGFFLSTLETLGIMLATLLALSWVMELLKFSGIMDRIVTRLAAFFRLAGIEKPAVPFATAGLLLGVSYGAALLCRDARTADVEPRQIFLVCVFMGFGHALIEDTLVVVAFGADLSSVLFARLAFAVLTTALIAIVINRVPDVFFFKFFFRRKEETSPDKSQRVATKPAAGSRTIPAAE